MNTDCWLFLVTWLAQKPASTRKTVWTCQWGELAVWTPHRGQHGGVHTAAVKPEATRKKRWCKRDITGSGVACHTIWITRNTHRAYCNPPVSIERYLVTNVDIGYKSHVKLTLWIDALYRVIIKTIVCTSIVVWLGRLTTEILLLSSVFRITVKLQQQDYIGLSYQIKIILAFRVRPSI